MRDDVRYQFGPFLLDPVERTLTRDGHPVRLTPKDVGVLLALVERHGTLVDRERLFARVWPGVVVEDCNLARHVATIRQALGDVAEAPVYIETLPKRGYRFVAPVEEVARPPGAPPRPPPPGPAAQEAAVDAEGPAAPAPEAMPAATAPAPDPVGSPRPPRWRLRHRALPRALAGVGGLACVSLLGWLSVAAPAGMVGPIRTVAVLPISNLTGEPRHDHVGESIGAMLVTDLGRQPELAVVSRGSSRRYDRSALSAREIGRELGVEGLLEAAVVRADDQVRVIAELVDVRTDRLVWAEVFEGDAVDLLELEDLIAEAVLEALELGPAPASHRDSARQAAHPARGPACTPGGAVAGAARP